MEVRSILRCSGRARDGRYLWTIYIRACSLAGNPLRLTRQPWKRRGLAAAAIAVATTTTSGAGTAEDFHLRAGIGIDRFEDAAFTDDDCSSESPVAVYGCGRGGDGANRLAGCRRTS